MSDIDTISRNPKLPEGSLSDIAASGGKIASIEKPGTTSSAGETAKLDGALTVPGFVDGHIHLDTSFYGDRWISHKPCTVGPDVHEHPDVVSGPGGKHGVDVDIHLHDAGSLGLFTREEICPRTVALGMQGHVAVSHAYGLADLAAVAPGGRLVAENGTVIR